LCDALDRGVRLIATTAPGEESPFAVGSLAARLEVVRLREMCARDSLQVLEKLRPFLVAHHKVKIASDVEQAAVDRARSLAGALPGKAVRLIDAAAARARLNQCGSVMLIDVFMAAARMLGESE
jgi:ATP-dependent Clp protease ATP-binding subunit ClpA